MKQIRLFYSNRYLAKCSNEIREMCTIMHHTQSAQSLAIYDDEAPSNKVLWIIMKHHPPSIRCPTRVQSHRSWQKRYALDEYIV